MPEPSAARRSQARSGQAEVSGRRPARRRRAGIRALNVALRRGRAHWVRPTQRRRLLIGLAVALGVLTVTAWVLYAGPWLRVRSVEVTGANTVQAERIRAVSLRHVGQPLVKVDIEALQSEVAALPPVGRVDVTRDWPDRLQIVVALRSPVIALRNAQGVVELVDGEGVAYAPADGSVRGLPLGTVGHPDQDRARVAAAKVMASLDAGQRSRVSTVTVRSPDDVVFVCDAVTVRWGGPEQGRQKAIVLAALLQQKGVRTINVSAPDSPVAS